MATNGTSGARNAVDAIEDPFLRRSIKGALHLRRYMPFYVFGLIWVLTLAPFPSIRGGATTCPPTAARGSPATPERSWPTTVRVPWLPRRHRSHGRDRPWPRRRPPAPRRRPAPRSPARRSPPPAPPGRPPPRPPPTGRSPRPRPPAPSSGARARPASARPAPPSPARSRTAATPSPARTSTTARTAAPRSAASPTRRSRSSGGSSRTAPNSKAVDEVNQRAGYASSDVTEAVRKTFIDHFNKAYELYGRKVKYVVYESKNGDSTERGAVQGQGGRLPRRREIAKELNAFAVMGGEPSRSPSARPSGASRSSAPPPYFPETFFRKYHPYLWNTVMECERISYQVAEYIGKRLHNKPAKWAGDPVLQKKTRYFATYVPDNDGYQSCVAITKTRAEEQVRRHRHRAAVQLPARHQPLPRPGGAGLRAVLGRRRRPRSSSPATTSRRRS